MNRIAHHVLTWLCVVAFALPTGWCCGTVVRAAHGSVNVAVEVAPPVHACCHVKTEQSPCDRSSPGSSNENIPSDPCCGCSCFERSAAPARDGEVKPQTVQVWLDVPVTTTDVLRDFAAEYGLIAPQEHSPTCSLQVMYCVWRC